MLPGFYEDVSAVARGWKENPVAFDSLFNRSTHTWSWGSPDILPMFAKGATPGRVETRMYSPEMEDFASADPSKLDTWVFDEFKMHLLAARDNEKLREKLSQGGVVFFLHLLGIDTSGHGYKPHSSQYLNGITIVDKGIAEATRLVEDFFGDNRTAFVFTADHGMTDWGSHGAGDATETMTPVVTWGAGVRGPRPTPRADSAFHVGPLRGLERRDLEQIDLAPFMAALIGAPVPVNSVARLPTHLLSLNDRYRYAVLYANWRQMIAQYEGKRSERAKATLKWFFTDYPPLSHQKLANIETQIQKLVDQRRLKAAGDLCDEWVGVVRDGFFYFHEYDRGLLSALVASIFLAFISLSSQIAAAPTTLHRLHFIPSRFDGSIRYSLGGMSIIAWFQSLNPSTIFYCILLLYLTRLLVDVVRMEVKSWASAWETAKLSCFYLGVSGVGSWVLVLAFFHRSVLSVLLICVGGWGWTGTASLPGSGKGEEVWLRRGWVLLCTLLSFFPLLPTIGAHSHALLAVLGPVLLVAAATEAERRNGEEGWYRVPRLRYVLYGGLGLSCTIALAIGSLPNVLQGPLRILSWILLFASPILPLMSRSVVGVRLEGLTLGFLIPYTLMSLSFETTFLILLSFLLAAWITFEARVNCSLKTIWSIDFQSTAPVNAYTRSGLGDWRRAYFFLFFLLLSFFGTGNIASINSFDPSFTRCFTTVFDPMVMGTLLLGKVVVPFLFVSTALVALERVLNQDPQVILLPLLVFADFMALAFFFLLKDKGSWLEIGTSISHYVIALGVTVFALLLTRLARLLTLSSFSIPPNLGINTD